MPRSTRFPAASRPRAASVAASPAAAPEPARRMTGRIIKVVRSRACGFIRTSDGQDVFFHVSDLGSITLDELDERLVVQFELVADAISGPRATQVQVVRPTSSAAPARRPRAPRASTSAALRPAR
ncbi:MAG: cold shock domain-containing protein [Acidobacteriota bacterium]